MERGDEVIMWFSVKPQSNFQGIMEHDEAKWDLKVIITKTTTVVGVS